MCAREELNKFILKSMFMPLGASVLSLKITLLSSLCLGAVPPWFVLVTFIHWIMIYPVIQGFAKSRPAVQRPAARGPRRPSGPRPATARRPAAPDGPAARWPSPDFQVFCPAVNLRACTDLHTGSRGDLFDRVDRIPS